MHTFIYKKIILYIYLNKLYNKVYNLIENIIGEYMANIGEYDEIQIQKNAFYLGDLTGCLKEKDNLMLEANDYYNRNRSLLYTIRTICEKKDYAMALTILKAYVTKNNIHDPNFLTLFTEFIKYYETKVTIIYIYIYMNSCATILEIFRSCD